MSNEDMSIEEVNAAERRGEEEWHAAKLFLSERGVHLDTGTPYQEILLARAIRAGESNTP